MCNKKGDTVTIYQNPLKQQEIEGEATLVQLMTQRENTERWIVQFKGENKLCRRTIARKDVDEGEFAKQPKMEKRIVNGELRYLYSKERKEKSDRYGLTAYEYYKKQIGKK